MQIVKSLQKIGESEHRWAISLGGAGYFVIWCLPESCFHSGKRTKMPMPIFQFPDGRVNPKSYVAGGFEGIYTWQTATVQILLIESKKSQHLDFCCLTLNSEFHFQLIRLFTLISDYPDVLPTLPQELISQVINFTILSRCHKNSVVCFICSR